MRTVDERREHPSSPMGSIRFYPVRRFVLFLGGYARCNAERNVILLAPMKHARARARVIARRERVRAEITGR